MSDTPAPKKEEKGLLTLDEQYFKDNANVGMEHVSPDDLLTPTLSIVQNTSKSVDADGRPYPRGKFLYKGNDTILDAPYCTFLSVVKKDLPNKYSTDPNSKVETFILLGTLEPDWKPFMLYMKSTGIMAVRQLFTKVRSSQIPLFAHRVQLISEEVKTPKGDYYAIRFNMLGMRKNMDEILLLEEMAKTYGAKITNDIEEANQPQQQPDPNDDFSDFSS